MSKNSDKNAVLERRRVELLHAIEHRYDREKVAKRVDALKQAVFAVAKKYNVRASPFRKQEDNAEWQLVVRFWDALPLEVAVDIVKKWRDRPGYKEVLVACRNVDNASVRKNSSDG